MKAEDKIEINDDKNCNINCRKTGILTNHEIRDYGIIDPDDMDDNCLKGTSYDMRLGDRHFVYQRDAQQWVPIFIGEEQGLKKANKFSPKFQREKCLTIEPFGTALIQHKETIDLYRCANEDALVAGRFDLKLKVVAKGLFSQQATQVEPYSRGKLYCYLFNLTPNEIKLRYNDKISTIEFYYISCITYCDISKKNDVLMSFDDEHKNGKYQRKQKEAFITKDFCNPHGINDIRYFFREEGDELRLPNHGGLTHLYLDFMKFKNDFDLETIRQQIIEAANKSFQGKYEDIQNQFKWIALIITIVITIIAGLAGLYFIVPSMTQQNKQIDDLKSEIKSLKESSNSAATKPRQK